MYRPQFPYPPAPAGCQDLRCSYSFDSSNTPYFVGTIAAGVLIQQVPLPLDKDADFFLRGIQIQATTLLIGILDAGGHPILLPSAAGLPPTLSVPLWAQCDGGPIVPLESDPWGIYCRAGSRLLANVQNSGALAVAGPVITLHGVKRFKGVKCQ